LGLLSVGLDRRRLRRDSGVISTLATRRSGDTSALRFPVERMMPGTGSPQANTALVRASFEAFNSGDTESLLAVVAPDLVMHLAELPEPLRGGRPGSRASR
jgi:hypothetical protein